MPYYICTETNTQCVNACKTDTCRDACRTDNPCGAQSPKRVNVTTTSAAATTSTTMPSVNTKEATGSATRFSIEMGHVVGSCALVGGFVAGFAVLL